MSKKQSTELAKQDTASLAFSADFEDLFGDLAPDEIVTGLEQTDESDFKIRLKVLNFKGQTKSGRACPSDSFFDTQTESAQEQIHAHLLLMHKSREWRTFSEKEKRSTIHCRSMDLKTGVMADGRTRPCNDSCPNYQWHTDEKGKPTRDCADVENVLGIETSAADEVPQINPENVFLIRFKKTSLSPWKRFMSAFFLKKLRTKMNGKMVLGDLPLWARATTIKLRLDSGGNYSVPEFEAGPYLPKALVPQFNDLAKSFSNLSEELEKAVEQDREADVASADRPNPNDFRDDFSDDGDVDDAELVDDRAASTTSSGKQAQLVGADF